MKKLFVLLILIFIAGAACSFVPLSFRFRLHHQKATEISTPVVAQEKQAPVFFLESADPLKAPVVTSKAAGVSTPTAEPLEMETSLTEIEQPDSSQGNQAGNNEIVEEQPIEVTPEFEPQYTRQMLAPIFTNNFVHTEKGCDWLGIAGQVFDANEEPHAGMLIVVKDKFAQEPYTLMGYSGLATQYGPGGYEIVLAEQNLGGEYSLQLFDADGEPLSTETWVTIPAGCENNLVLINFIDLSKSNIIFMPIVQR